MTDHTTPAATDIVRRATILVGEHTLDGYDNRGNDVCTCGWQSSDDGELWPDHLVHVLAAAGLILPGPEGGA